MDDDKDQAGAPQAKPQQGQRQQGDGRQGIQHGRQGFQQVAPEAAGHCQQGQHEGGQHAHRIALQQDGQGRRRAREQFTAGDAANKRLRRLQKTGQE